MPRAILHIPWGPQAFAKAVLAPGDRLRISAQPSADFQIIRDKRIGAASAEVSWDGSVGQVTTDASHDAFLLNGQALPQGTLQHGEWFRIGDTTLMLCEEQHTPPRRPKTRLTAEEQQARAAHAGACEEVLATLRGAQSLYAVLDPARSDRILTLLRESGNPARSLLSGVRGDALADVAPYLVRLTPDDWLLAALVHEGWGQSWGIFLDCPKPFDQVRRHFRHFLRVRAEGEKDFLFFRFYDPRVLRIFLPTCTPEQLAEFYGPILRFFGEGSEGDAPDRPQLFDLARPPSGLRPVFADARP